MINDIQNVILINSVKIRYIYVKFNIFVLKSVAFDRLRTENTELHFQLQIQLQLLLQFFENL